MTAFASQKASRTGLAPAFSAAAAGGDTFKNTGRTVLRVKNGGGGPVTVTVQAATACNHGVEHDSVSVVAAAGDVTIGPFPVNQFGSNPTVNYSGVVTVTVAVINL